MKHQLFAVSIESMVKLLDNLKLVYSISIKNLHRSTDLCSAMFLLMLIMIIRLLMICKPNEM